MAATKYNARDCVFQIEDPGTPGTYVAIKGIDTFTRSRSGQNTETTDFDSGGHAEGQMMERGKTLKLDGSRLQDAVTGALDPGQALVETLADQVGTASLGTVRFAAPADTTWEVWTAYAEMGDEGGGNNDKASWSVTFTRSGASTTAARP